LVLSHGIPLTNHQAFDAHLAGVMDPCRVRPDLALERDGLATERDGEAFFLAGVGAAVDPDDVVEPGALEPGGGINRPLTVSCRRWVRQFNPALGESDWGW
jgi:hypothetical protein